MSKPEIRSDLWSTMTIEDLIEQQDLLMERYYQANAIASSSTAAAAMALAIQSGIDALSQLINNKTQNG